MVELNTKVVVFTLILNTFLFSMFMIMPTTITSQFGGVKSFQFTNDSIIDSAGYLGGISQNLSVNTSAKLGVSTDTLWGIVSNRYTTRLFTNSFYQVPLLKQLAEFFDTLTPLFAGVWAFISFVLFGGLLSIYGLPAFIAYPIYVMLLTLNIISVITVVSWIRELLQV